MIQGLLFKNLFIFEMANNHEGDVDHGLKIIREIREVSKDFDFQFGFKLQYRDLDTFIHPDFKERSDIKYVKRFQESALSAADFKLLKDEIVKSGFISVCTPFDENSVSLVEAHDFDIIKIGSCSFTDWPLLERIAGTDKPIIASTAGASLEDIDRVVLFFEHREKQFALMHCVGEYSTPDEYLELNQIDLLRKRYAGIPVGYSTHEDPGNLDAVKIAVAKGACIFEKHVGIKTAKYTLNSYSADPEQIHKWLEAAKEAYAMCGIAGERRKFSDKESSDLRGLRRGVFARKDITKGERIRPKDTFYAIPNTDGQIAANDLSRYTEYTAENDIKINQPILIKDVKARNLRAKIVRIMGKIQNVLVDSKISVPNKLEFELSHHYGIDRYEEWGAALINCINREYCKKLIILLPGQRHPVHHHVKKEEAFNVLYGDVAINIEGTEKMYKPGEMVVIEKGAKHSFSSKCGAIFEEISTTYYADDSFYDDREISKNPERKTYMTFWSDWLNKPIV